MSPVSFLQCNGAAMSVQERLDALSAASDYAAEQEKLGECMRQVTQTRSRQNCMLVQVAASTRGQLGSWHNGIAWSRRGPSV